MELQRIPETTQTLYVELLTALLQGAYPKRGLTFHTKQISGEGYWYLQSVVGAQRRSFYIGKDDVKTAARIKRAKERWEEDAPDAKRRARLVSMLVSGGATTLPASHARVLTALEQTGVFVAGGVVVGSHAFTIMANMLGVRWQSGMMRTQDLDIANDYQIHLNVPDKNIDIEAVLRETERGFFAVPSLSRKQPSTTYSIRGADLSVSLLTPMRGKPDSTPRLVSSLNAMASPLRFLDYLLEDIQPAAVPARSGVLVNIPSPGRFSLHKLVVSQRRIAAFHAKSRKDIAQAAAVLEVLFADRPGDVTLAIEAANDMPEKFNQQLEQAANLLPEPIRKNLIDLIKS